MLPVIKRRVTFDFLQKRRDFNFKIFRKNIKI